MKIFFVVGRIPEMSVSESLKLARRSPSMANRNLKM